MAKLIAAILLCALSCSAQKIVGNSTGVGSSTWVPGVVSNPVIALDVNGTPVTANSGTTVTATITPTSGKTLSVIIAYFYWVGGNSTTGGCTAGGVSMTQMWNIRETVLNQYGSAAFIIPNGTATGSAVSIVCTPGFSLGNGVAVIPQAWSGVNQSTLFRTPASPTTLNGTTTTGSVTVSNAVSGDVVVDSMSVNFNTTQGSTVTSTNTLQAESLNIVGNNFSGFTSSAAATGSTTMTYNWTSVSTIGIYDAAALIP